MGVVVGVTYCVKSPLLALRPDYEMPRFLTLPAGTVITITGESQYPDFVEISYEGQTVAAFAQDIDVRCERVNAQAER